MIRVLQVLGGTNLGGAESRVMDIYRHMNRDNVQFDFLVTKGNTGHFDKEIESLGGHIYTLPRFRIYNYFEYTKAVKSFFAEHEYVAVHGHMTSTASIYLPIAKKAGVPLTIAHARSAGVDSGIKGDLTNYLRKNLYKKCDIMISCSDLAAKAVFGEEQYNDGKVIVMPNAIKVADYVTDEKARQAIRAEYHVEDKLVIGHVGRFHEAKNHMFMLDVFDKILEKREDAVLMLVGDGSLRESITEKIAALDQARKLSGKEKISDKIIMTGNQAKVAPFYQAFDAFLFPSIFEGMPGSVVEAQAAGLKCLISDAITTEVKATELVEFVSLHKTTNEWRDKFISMIGDETSDELWSRRTKDNPNIQQSLTDSKYNVENQVKYYTMLYSKGE